MTNTTDAGYTPLHASCALCGGKLEPRIKSGKNTDRFCSPECRYRWHNEKRRTLRKQNPPSAATDAVGEVLLKKKNTKQSTKTARKWERVLAGFVAGRSFNRFEAEHTLSDHCLHSTVSELQARGVLILRHFETVPGYGGAPTRCCRYQLDPESTDRARELLGTQNGA
ncbi:MAG: hypothetical protein ACYDBH_20145 [Acidobacteriaceae bacterium]